MRIAKTWITGVVVLAAVTMSLTPRALAADKPRKGPLKVFILAGQSNMEGQASAGTLEQLRMSMREDAALDKLLEQAEVVEVSPAEVEGQPDKDAKDQKSKAKKTAKKSAKKTVKKTAKKTVKKTAKKTAKKTVKNSAGKTAGKSVRKSAGKPPKHSQ